MRFLAVYLSMFLFFLVSFNANVSSSHASQEPLQSTDYDESEEENSTAIEGDVAYPTGEPRWETQCETPDSKIGYCMEMSKCSPLRDLVGDSKAEEFIRASMCGPPNENPSNPRVCCGLYKPKPQKKKAIDILPKACGRQKVITWDRIIGGEEAALGEFPWMARIIMRSLGGYRKPGCGGALIHKKFVLTAAHCIKTGKVTTITPYSVILGEHNAGTEIDCNPDRTKCADRTQEKRIDRAIVHPAYNPRSAAFYNDIAILYLKKSIRMNDYVQPICLLEDPYDIPHSYSVSGWGKTETSETSNVKQKVQLPSQSREKCQEPWSLYNITVKSTQLCAGGQERRDTCRGDSGGPLMMLKNGTVWFAAGIVSFGLGCGREGWPGIYTNIPSYVPWITSTMEQILSEEMSRRQRSKLSKKQHQS